MTDANTEAHATSAPTDAEEMAKYGIIRTQVDYFHCGNYRYTNLEDAIAQAKRNHEMLKTTDQNSN